MDSSLHDILNIVNEGIVILDINFNILIWNMYMESVTQIPENKAIDKNIFNILPNFNKNYFKTSIQYVIKNEIKMFFSATIHRNIVNDKEDFNIKISSFERSGEKFIFIEFINVTNQIVRIKQLKNYINELNVLNKKLVQKEKIIKNMAYYDNLTGLANRPLFNKISNKFLIEAKRNNYLLGLMFIDADRFKNVNDIYGHKKGDYILSQIAAVLKKSTRKNDVIARYGGDEFLVLLPNIKSKNNYKVISSRIKKNKEKYINSEDENINISLSIGVSFYPDDGDTIDELIVAADKAMYAAKNQEGNDISRSSIYI